MSASSALFVPFEHKGLSLANRIVMAPMTRNFAPDGVPGQDVADYYRRRAEAEVGLVITEGTVVDRPEARNDPGIPFFHGEGPLAGWKHVVEEVHRVGGKIAPQIWHTGLVKNQFPDRPRPGEPEGPSGLYAPGEPYGRAMTEEDVADTVAAFVDAASQAVALGFDTIEFHGAHGYLIDQFFSGDTNRRSDRWGGDTLPQRTRFAAEILRQTRAAIGDAVPIIIRVSQWSQQDYKRKLTRTPQEMEAWLMPLVEAGADILHCSQRRFWIPEFPELDGEQGLNFAGWAKKLTGVPTISVGSVALDGDFFGTFQGQDTSTSDIGDLERRMEKGEFDLIAVGRALISNPDWAVKVREDRLGELKGFASEQLAELH